ncbi:DNA replication regulator sld2 [Niveomyces insectorum RCEF 264]|uniref:DNA replication regulator SLD2 n=1 Tax=Niveomyces insectorum RCEF 264 TaxID=1081102 RepID=A0A167X8Z3_9HYPO|nr:DNA replication regulator sld2 [Niveomyces insectorum RCEF 264]
MSNAEDRKAYEAESQQLRLELKAWETAWAREHGGAKPGRNDIKRHADIAQKYTAYNRVRNLLAGKEAPASDAKTAAKSRETRRDEDGTARRKRKQPATYDASGQLHTPSKRRRSTETPRKAGAAAAMAAAAADTVTPETARRLFSPVVPTSIGPTPQRDGRILGLFDVLSEEKRTHPTPSKRNVLEGPGAAAPGAVPFALTGIAATPRAQTRTIDVETDMEETRRLGRTPMSPAKRNLLAQFAGPAPTSTPRATYQPLGTTPLKTRDANVQLPPPPRVFAAQPFSLTTPSKKDDAPQPFATPAFLRRTSTRPLPPSSSLPVDENGEFLSPPGRVWLPRKPLVRGLSSVLASLRRMEDEQLDDELDVLRDLEREEEEAGKRNGAAASTTTTTTKSLADDGADAPAQGNQPTQAKTADVLDRQRMQPPPSPSPHVAPPLRLLGGFDDDGLYDSPPEDQAGRDGQPLRVFKKKGQKRTTRLVHMRPMRTKRPALGAMAKASDDDDDDDDDDNDDGMRTEDKQGTEVDVVPETQVAAEDASGSEFGSGGEDDEPARKKASKTKTKKKAKEKKATGTSRGGKEGTVRKAVRKVNELAHANFKRLKLRNNGAKGGPGFNSRFRRRR